MSQELKVIATGATIAGGSMSTFRCCSSPSCRGRRSTWPGFCSGYSRSGKKDATFRTIVYAILCVFVPLAVTPEVQPHYLVPMLPCCATLVGWIIVRTLAGELDVQRTKTIGWIFRGTLVACLVAGPATLAIGYVVKKSPLLFTELLAMFALIGSSMLILTVFKRRGIRSRWRHGRASC